MLLHKLITTCFGIGYISKGGGTVAAAFCCLCMYGLYRLGFEVTGIPGLVTAAGITLLGVWSGSNVEPLWGKDNYRVVIDEVAGMWISILFVPFSVPVLIAGFVLFRLFDIWKPLFIKKIEKLPGGTGVMLDDVIAGIYACAVLHLIVAFRWLS